MFELRTCDWLCSSVLGCALLAVTQTAAAQSFPSRPLTLVVPFAAGGPSDVAGRIVAQGLGEKLGQQVVVENPAGAGGTLGSLRVVKAPPDGYQNETDLVVADPFTGDIKKKVRVPYPNNSGALTTAGGLVFTARKGAGLARDQARSGAIDRGDQMRTARIANAAL
jgi:Tripartite tricarboxylate transporter family receptor